VSRNQKGKTNLYLLEQETVSGSGMSWVHANLHLDYSITLEKHTSRVMLGSFVIMVHCV